MIHSYKEETQQLKNASKTLLFPINLNLGFIDLDRLKLQRIPISLKLLIQIGFILLTFPQLKRMKNP